MDSRFFEPPRDAMKIRELEKSTGIINSVRLRRGNYFNLEVGKNEGLRNRDSTVFKITQNSDCRLKNIVSYYFI